MARTNTISTRAAANFQPYQLEGLREDIAAAVAATEVTF